MNARTVQIPTDTGGHVEAEQFATFTAEIGNAKERFGFAVTRIPRQQMMPVVTHRKSGKRVCDIPFVTLQACLGDYEQAGRSVLRQLIEAKGAERVASVLRAAEA